MSDWYKKLCEPFPQEAIHWRIGATDNKDNPTRGIPLAYIDARDVMDRLDEVVGPENWEDKFFETSSGRVICELTIRGVTKSDGAGATDMEGEKGGLSDAFKRAAVKFGVGRYLYSLGTQWVAVERRGKSTVIKGDPPALPEWALPKPNILPMPTKLVLVPKESHQPEPMHPGESLSMQGVFSELYRSGITTIGGEEFMRRVNLIIDNGYGGKDWKDLPIEDARRFYSDVVKAIKNGKENK